jgi:hypothetical protein
MFGRKARSERERGGSRIESAMFTVFGPASVEGALQGHSPEARAHWKNRVAAEKRARAEASRQKAADRG